MTTSLEPTPDHTPAAGANPMPDAQFRALLDVLPALIVTTNKDGTIEQISASYRAYTGLTLEEARDWQSHSVIHPDDEPQSMQRWTAAIESGEPMQNEMRLRRHDGAYRWYLVQAVPMRDTTGKVLRWVTISVDIDDRKQAEARERFLADTTARMLSLLDSRQFLRDIARLAVPVIADICAIGIFDGGPHTPRIEVAGVKRKERKAVDRIHLRRWRAGPDSAELINDRISRGEAVYIPDFDESFISACAPDEEQREAAAAVGGRSMICVPLVARGTSFGMATFAMTHSRRRYTEQDLALISEVVGRASIVVDNAELYENLRRSAEELQRANATKDEFLGLISHELKTPITTIYGNADILQRQGRNMGEAQWQNSLSDISREAERLHRIIDNLLVLARLEQDQRPQMEPVSLPRLLERLVLEHLQRHPMRRIELILRGETVPPVLGEPLYIEQVARNLVSNAEKYSQWDRRIELHVERGDGEVELHVLDLGPGIEEGEQDRIFTPFYRSPRTSEKVGGVGVGLAVCKRLIEVQGGRIWALNREGGGADFGFALPSIDTNDLPA